MSAQSEQSVDKGLAFARQLLGAEMPPAAAPALNPFRAPLRLPQVDGGAVGFPAMSNGFIAAIGAPASFAEPEAAPPPPLPPPPVPTPVANAPAAVVDAVCG